MRELLAYRAPAQPFVPPTPTMAGLRRFRITCDGVANVRQGPGVGFPVAGTLKSGAIVFVDVLKDQWVHMARVANEQADLGFIADHLGVWL